MHFKLEDMFGVLLLISILRVPMISQADIKQVCPELLTSLSPSIVRTSQAKRQELLSHVEHYERKWRFDINGDENHYSGADMTYNLSFGRALGYMTIENFLQARKASGLPTHIFDLFGSASFLEKLENVDTMTSGRLEGTTKPNQYASEKWFQIIGNFLTTPVWNGLKKYLKENHIGYFDLIFFRPIGASRIFYYNTTDLKTREVSLHELFRLFKNTYNVLSPDSGVLLFTLEAFGFQTADPRREDTPDREVLLAFFEFLTRNNIQYEIHQNDSFIKTAVIKIVKTKLSLRQI